MTDSKEYLIWTNIRQWCNNPKNPRYKDFGANGVRLAPEWEHDLLRFLADMGPMPDPSYTVVRLDESRNYEPGNCVWKIKRVMHGLTEDSIYGLWDSIKQRCYNPKHTKFRNHGGRGISMCDRWRYSFEAFKKDMGPRPSRKYSVERIDNNKNYTPENCKWATNKEQSRNKRTNRIVTYKGESLPLIVWGERTGLGFMVLYDRIFRLHWDIAEAMTEPIRH